MYTVDDKDTVSPLENVPPSSAGAPCPLVLADEGTLLVAYYLHVADPAWDGTSVREVEPESTTDPVAVVTFRHYTAMMFGPPNDEAFEGHPLAERGLHPYAAHEVRRSSWIRTLEKMNSVHPCHTADAFKNLRHFIFAFHDSTLECVAAGFTISRHDGPLHQALDFMKGQLQG